jgi:hypothetical protein
VIATPLTDGQDRVRIKNVAFVMKNFKEDNQWPYSTVSASIMKSVLKHGLRGENIVLVMEGSTS